MTLDLTKLSRKEKEKLLLLIEEKKRRDKFNKLFSFFPEEGELSRHRYPKHLKVFKAGKDFKERAVAGANRSGKSVLGAVELTYHVTGMYPEWWEGLRFNKPIVALAASNTNLNTRNIIQSKLLGDVIDIGSGMIPKDCIVRTSAKAGIPDAKQDIYVKHASGGVSRIILQSYEQGRESFQGTEYHFAWLDEEPPIDIYSEALTRLLTTDGSLLLTFTPLMGITDVVLSFRPGGQMPKNGIVPGTSKYVEQIFLDEVPHLTKKQREDYISSLLPHEIEARTKGEPAIGSGKIYPLPESMFTVDPFVIPSEWPRVYGLDVGFVHKTAGVWAAIDPNSGVVYLYDEYYRDKAEPVIHIDAIKRKGEWIPGVVDPSAGARSRVDGKVALDMFLEGGLDLSKADNAVESGLQKTYQMLSAGQLKVFSSLTNWFSEYRLYRRDEKGRIVKEHDDLMDATRYLVSSGLELALIRPDEDEEDDYSYISRFDRASTTGY